MKHQVALIALVLSAAANVGEAAISMFTGVDVGAGPADARPNSDAAAASFDAAAGPLPVIDFEGAPFGDFTTLLIGTAVTATVPGTDPGFGGIRTTSTYFGGVPPVALYGYNTTPGGTKFLGFVPRFNVFTAALKLDFADPINAFGAYLTGIDSGAAGVVHAQFNDGSAQDIKLSDPDGGGAQFFGFISPGAAITRLTFLELGVAGLNRDVWAIDDIRYGHAVPEPESLVVFATGLLIVGGLGFFPRRSRAGRCSRSDDQGL